MKGVDYRVIKEEKFEIMEIQDDLDPENIKNEDIYAEYLIEEDDPDAIEKIINYELENEHLNTNVKLELLADHLKNSTAYSEDYDNVDPEYVFNETPPKKRIMGETIKKSAKTKTPRSLPKIHQCPVEDCKMIFPNYTRLKTHSRKHSDERNFSCDECGALFKARTYMMRHKQTHRGIRFTCDICGKDFGNRLNIHNHMKTHVLSGRPICHLCGKTVSNPGMLKLHMLYSHGGEKNFKCHICEKAFFTKGRLKQHIEATHGERPWVCEICSRNFSKRYKLGEHMKQTHKISLLPPKKFVCTLCGINFDRNKALQIHLRDKHQVVVEEFDDAQDD